MTEQKFKVRTRLSAIDVRALVRDLSATVRGMRLSNVFDFAPTSACPRSYGFKFSGTAAPAVVAEPPPPPSTKGETEKVVLLVEPPARMHTTRFERAKREVPSVLTLKLRKHIRGKRLERVEQLGIDRVVRMTFGVGDTCFHVIVELYAQGNLILADAQHKILAVLRRHEYADDCAVSVHSEYPLSQVKQLPFEPPSVPAAVAAAKDDSQLRDIARSIADVGPHLLEHAILAAGLDPSRCPKKEPLSEQELASLADSLRGAHELFASLAQSTVPAKAWILLKPGKPDEGDQSQRYYDFAPFAYEHHKRTEAKEMATFDAALDEFFTKLEMAQVMKQRASQEKSVERKLEKLAQDQQGRLTALEEGAERSRRSAALIEYNLPLVERVITDLRAAIASGLPWNEIDAMVKNLRKTDPTSIATFIEKLNLRANKVTLLLSEPADDGDAEKDAERVEVDVGMSAHANVERLYTEAHAWKSKAKKTADVAEKVLQRAEKKYQQDAKKSGQRGASASAFTAMRKRFWFEKFHWFISSENFIVVSGKDMQQNEQLYKRYLKDRDLYVHADVHGAATCVVKNPTGKPIGAATLEQAGRHAVCRSSAWAGKIVTSAWWVRPAQVSKSAPTGEYLTTGSFMIRGKKNFLPPHQLIMGFGILFALDPACVAAHAGERKLPEDESAIPATDDGGAASASDMAEPTTVEEDWASMAESKVADEPKRQQQQIAPPTAAVATTAEAAPPKPAPAQQEQKKHQGKVRMSAYEKRQLKKQEKSPKPEEAAPAASETPGKVEEEDKEEEEEPEEDVAEEEEEEEESSARSKSPQAKPKHMTKAKARRMRKYADQDEEDRKVRMMLIGSAPKVETSAAGEKKSDSKLEDGSKCCFICGSKAHYARSCPQRQEIPPERLEGGDADDGVQGKGSAEDGATAEADSSDEEEAAEGGLTEADRLTGQPRSDDVLLFALPVCAPYDSLQAYKYKVKITPGHLKRSKAVDSAIQIFLKQTDVTEQERKLIQAIPHDEMLQTILGDVTVAGGQASARFQKGKKK